jgi:hypothetical protein
MFFGGRLLGRSGQIISGLIGDCHHFLLNLYIQVAVSGAWCIQVPCESRPDVCLFFCAKIAVDCRGKALTRQEYQYYDRNKQ